MEFDGWFTLASHLGMPIEQCIDGHTHRQFRAWLAWLEMQWNKPTRQDHYLMQIAATIKRLLAKNPKSITLDQFVIPFVRKGGSDDLAQLKAQQKAAKESERTWLQFFGIVPEDHKDGN